MRGGPAEEAPLRRVDIDAFPVLQIPLDHDRRSETVVKRRVEIAFVIDLHACAVTDLPKRRVRQQEGEFVLFLRTDRPHRHALAVVCLRGGKSLQDFSVVRAVVIVVEEAFKEAAELLD